MVSAPLASNIPVSWNMTSNTTLNRIFENSDLVFTGAFNVKQSIKGGLLRSNTELTVHAIRFESSLGNHVAVHMKGAGHEELAHLILAAEPGIPLGVNNLTKRDNFNVDWLSYNYDNANKDLSADFFGEEYTDATNELAGDISTFMINNGGWKYCMNPIYYQGTPGDDSAHAMEDGDTGTAIHGEVYFNTYGGVDGQCNDFYDCTEGSC